MNTILSKLSILKYFKKKGISVFLQQIERPVVTPCSFILNPSNRCFHLGSKSYVPVEVSQDVSENKEDQEELDAKFIKYADLATDSEREKKIRMILMEHWIAHLEGKKVPTEITIDGMKELLSFYSFSTRYKYMNFLHEKEIKKSTEKRKKEKRQQDYANWLIEKQQLKPPEHIEYGIGKNTMILRVRRASIFRHAYQRLANTVLFGQKLIIDMDFDCYMRKQDCNNCGEQLLEMYGANRKNLFPYDLTFCNVERDSPTMSAFSRFMPNLHAPDNFISLTESSYLDMYPKDKLVYITPHAREPLKVYDHNVVYILAGVVDKCIREPVVLSKAKREGLRAVHLPFDEYLMWGRGNKSLPMNHLVEILLEMKNTNDWNKAFKHVPQRKLVRSLELYTEYL